MRAAAASIDITPSGVFYLSGYRNELRRRPARGVHDQNYAELVYLADDDAPQALFVAIDVCHVSRAQTDRMRSELSRYFGLTDEQVVIGAIHSHACPTGFNRPSVGLPETPGYNAKVTGLVVEAASKLPERAVEVTARMLIAPVEGWYGDRSHPERPFVDEATIICFDDLVGTPVAAMMNLNCHSTVLGPLNDMLSPDLIGGVRRTIGEWLGVVPYTFPGATANISNRHFRRGNDFAELARVVNGVSGCIMLGSFEPIELVKPHIRRFTTTVGYNAKEAFADLDDRLCEIDAELAAGPTSERRKLLEGEREGVSAKLEQGNVSFPIEMTVLDFGPLVFVTFCGELESRLGERVRALFPHAHAVIMGYANDYRGYFIAQESFGDTFESMVTECPQGMIEQVLDEFEGWL